MNNTLCHTQFLIFLHGAFPGWHRMFIQPEFLDSGPLTQASMWLMGPFFLVLAGSADDLFQPSLLANFIGRLQLLHENAGVKWAQREIMSGLLRI